MPGRLPMAARSGKNRRQMWIALAINDFSGAKRNRGAQVGYRPGTRSSDPGTALEGSRLEREKSLRAASLRDRKRMVMRASRPCKALVQRGPAPLDDLKGG